MRQEKLARRRGSNTGITFGRKTSSPLSYSVVNWFFNTRREPLAGTTNVKGQTVADAMFPGMCTSHRRRRWFRIRLWRVKRAGFQNTFFIPKFRPFDQLKLVPHRYPRGQLQLQPEKVDSRPLYSTRRAMTPWSEIAWTPHIRSSLSACTLFVVGTAHLMATWMR